MDQQHVYLILLKDEHSTFTQAPFSSLSDIHECSGGLQMAPFSINKHIANCDLPHDWLMSLAMDLAALCDMWRWKWQAALIILNIELNILKLYYKYL